MNPPRDADPFDVLADALGIGVAILLLRTPLARLLASGEVQEPIGLWLAGPRIRLSGPYFRRFLTHRAATGRRSVENLSSHSRILASATKARQAPRYFVGAPTEPLTAGAAAEDAAAGASASGCTGVLSSLRRVSSPCLNRFAATW